MIASKMKTTAPKCMYQNSVIGPIKRKHALNSAETMTLSPHKSIQVFAQRRWRQTAAAIRRTMTLGAAMSIAPAKKNAPPPPGVSPEHRINLYRLWTTAAATRTEQALIIQNLTRLLRNSNAVRNPWTKSWKTKNRGHALIGSCQFGPGQ